MSDPTKPPFDDAGKNRQQTNDDEQQMWDRLQEEVDRHEDPNPTIYLARIASDQMSMHKHRATDIIASWRNRGLVRTFSADCHVRMTSKGQEVGDV